MYDRKTALNQSKRLNETFDLTSSKQTKWQKNAVDKTASKKSEEKKKIEAEIEKGKALDLMLTNYYFNGLLDHNAINKQN